MRFSIFFSVILFAWTGCSVHEEPNVYHEVIAETPETGQVEIQLTWSVNGVPDDGMLVGMDLYVSRSEDMDDASVINGLQSLNVGSLNIYGGRRMVPSTRYMFPAYRFFLGAAFNGVRDKSASLTYPLNIQYQIKIFFQKSKKEIKTITGNLMVASADVDQTVVEYKHSMDIIYEDGEEEAQYRKYSIREIANPILLTRKRDVVDTTAFSSSSTLYIDLLWRSNGNSPGYKNIDLDLILHDINNTNVTGYSDLDAYSASSDSYEEIAVLSTDTYCKEGIPEKLGWYFYNNEQGLSSTVDYMLRVYSYDTKIKEHLYFGSFTTPPVQPKQGAFYFNINVTRSGDSYVVEDLPSVLEWTP